MSSSSCPFCLHNLFVVVEHLSSMNATFSPLELSCAHARARRTADRISKFLPPARQRVETVHALASKPSQFLFLFLQTHRHVEPRVLSVHDFASSLVLESARLIEPDEVLLADEHDALDPFIGAIPLHHLEVPSQHARRHLLAPVVGGHAHGVYREEAAVGVVRLHALLRELAAPGPVHEPDQLRLAAAVGTSAGRERDAAKKRRGGGIGSGAAASIGAARRRQEGE